MFFSTLSGSHHPVSFAVLCQNPLLCDAPTSHHTVAVSCPFDVTHTNKLWRSETRDLVYLVWSGGRSGGRWLLWVLSVYFTYVSENFRSFSICSTFSLSFLGRRGNGYQRRRLVRRCKWNSRERGRRFPYAKKGIGKFSITVYGEGFVPTIKCIGIMLALSPSKCNYIMWEILYQV